MKRLAVLRSFWNYKLPIPVGVRAFAAGMLFPWGMFQIMSGVLFWMVIAIVELRAGVSLPSLATFAVAGGVGCWHTYRGARAIADAIKGSSNLEG